MAADDDQLAEWTSELLRFPLSVPRDTMISPWPRPHDVLSYRSSGYFERDDLCREDGDRDVYQLAPASR